MNDDKPWIDKQINFSYYFSLKEKKKYKPENYTLILSFKTVQRFLSNLKISAI